MKEKVSIIVPIFNAEKTLNRCVESLLRQSYENIEIILVNDGSKDASWIICKRLHEKSNKIKLLSKENGGVSSARNAGIHIASGSKMVFVDSDDYVESDYIANFIYGG